MLSLSERKHSAVINSNHLDKRTSTEKVLTSLATEAAREAISAHRNSTGGTTLAPSSSLYNPTSAAPQISYNLGNCDLIIVLVCKLQLICN